MSGEQIKPGYKRTEVGVIPEEWEASTIGDNSMWLSGGTPSRDHVDYWSGSIPWISGSTLKSVELATSDQFLTVEGVSAGSKMAPLNSTLLLVRGSALHNEIRAGLVVAPVSFNQDVKALVPVRDLEPKFLTYYILAHSEDLLKLVSSAGNSAGVLDTELVQNFKFLKPPLPEQRAIATALSDVDALLTKLDQLIAKKRDLKQATMQQLLTGQTRLPGFSGEWEVKRLGDVGFANWGNVEITKDYYCESGFTAYSASGADGLVSWYEHEGEGIILSAIGAQCGKSWLATGRWTPIKNTIWIKGLPDKLNSSFLYWISQSPDFWPTRGQAQPFIALGDVRNVFFSCPAPPEQTAIATVLSDMDAQLASLEARREKTRALKQGMMQELLTGRIRLV